MAQQLPFAEDISRQLLSDALGQELSETEFSNSLAHLRWLQPAAGKRFWETTSGEVGLYLILRGKVRLLDRQDELLATLSTGATFGAMSLFPDVPFYPYVARASVNLRLAFLPEPFLKSLMRRYPQIREHLHEQATQQDQQLFATQPPPIAAEVPAIATLPRPSSRNRRYFPSPTLRAGHFWQRLSQRYPFFAQQSASDCGAACLVMISRYWGKRASVNRLRDIANVDRNGASLRGLTTAAESIGFSTRPVVNHCG